MLRRVAPRRGGRASTKRKQTAGRRASLRRRSRRARARARERASEPTKTRRWRRRNSDDKARARANVGCRRPTGNDNDDERARLYFCLMTIRDVSAMMTVMAINVATTHQSCRTSISRRLCAQDGAIFAPRCRRCRCRRRRRRCCCVDTVASAA